jgi:hypothetical protein
LRGFQKRRRFIAKRWISLLTLVVAISASGDQSKANIVYDLVDYPQFQNGYNISGTITTDGTIGDLITANIVSWGYTIKSGSTNVFSAASSDLNAMTYINSGAGLVYATHSSISVNALNGGAGIFLYDGPSFGDMHYSMGQNGSFIVTQAGKNGGPVYWNNYTNQSVVTFATVAAVPEPSTYATALAGLTCGAYSLFRRRKRA